MQDALGNGNASVTIDISGSTRSATVTGAPTGSLPSSAYGPATVVSLSPQAQGALSQAQIALDVLGGLKTGHGASATAAAPVSSPVQEPIAAVQPAPPVTAASISDVVKNDASALNDPAAVFYACVNETGGPASIVSGFTSVQEQQSFIDAFNNRTLNIQNASDVAGLDYRDSTVLTGTSIKGGGSYNGQYVTNKLAEGIQSSLMIFPAVGAIYYSWPAPTTAGGSAASTTAG